MDADGLLATVSAGGVVLLAVGAVASLLVAAVRRPWLAVGLAAAGLVGVVCWYGMTRAGRTATPYW